jgi:hypothetical protein
MSRSASRERMRPRIEITAPMVPKGLRNGSGMKYGSEASTRWMRAAMKCPSSWLSRMARSGTANGQPPGSARSRPTQPPPSGSPLPHTAAPVRKTENTVATKRTTFTFHWIGGKPCLSAAGGGSENGASGSTAGAQSASLRGSWAGMRRYSTPRRVARAPARGPSRGAARALRDQVEPTASRPWAGSGDMESSAPTSATSPAATP